MVACVVESRKQSDYHTLRISTSLSDCVDLPGQRRITTKKWVISAVELDNRDESPSKWRRPSDFSKQSAEYSTLSNQRS